MPITFSAQATITDAFRNLIKAKLYEEYVYKIILKSEMIFGGQTFIHVEDQSKGEPDFVDQNGIKYEAKLVFNKKQGQLLGEHKNDIAEWFDSMRKEAVEFSAVIKKQNLDIVKETRLYAILKERLASVKEDENVIFFIPYPIVNDVRNAVFLQFGTDFLQAAYNKMNDENLLGNRRVYFIYPSVEAGVYVLRDGNYRREYIPCNELDDLVVYKTSSLY